MDSHFAVCNPSRFAFCSGVYLAFSLYFKPTALSPRALTTKLGGTKKGDRLKEFINEGRREAGGEKVRVEGKEGE